MSDIDVGVGIKVTGDATGAQQVDEALKKVAATAQTVNDSAGKGVGSVADDIGTLDEALKKLSPEKAKQLLGGLVQTLVGLGSGEVSTSLSGLARHLQGLSGLIPLPGAALLLAATAGGIAAIYRALSKDIEDAKRPLTEFGLTVDKEMERLESWAKAEIKWEGIASANEKLRADLGTVKSVADSTLTALEKVFQVQSDARLSKLQKDLSAAQEAGDTGKASQIQSAIDGEKYFAQLVQINNRMAVLEADYAETLEKNRQIEENGRKASEEAAAATKRLEDLKAAVEKQTGNADAVYDGGARSKLVDALESMIDSRERRRQAIQIEESNIGRPMTGKYIEEDRRQIGEIPELKGLIEQLASAAEIIAAAKKAEEDLNEQRKTDAEEAKKILSEMVAKGLELETARQQRAALASEAGPEVSGRASAQSTQITGALADLLESSLQMTAGNAEATKQAAAEQTASALAAVKTAEQLKSEYARSIENIWAAAAEGRDLAPLEQEMRTLFDALSRLGQAAAVSNPGDIMASIAATYENGVSRLRAAGAQVQQAAEANAAELDETASGFIAGITEANQKLSAAGKSLNDFVSDLLSTVESLSTTVKKAAQAAADAQRKAAAAESDSSLALSQIRNAKR